MAADESNNDCYFYYYSSCAKGEDCPYRHCQAALGTEIVCSLWRAGRCFRSNCKFRHLEIRKNRTAEQCYWENQPGGCRKPHCVYFHKKPRFNMYTSSENQGLILPVSANSVPSIPTSKVINSKGSDVKDLASLNTQVNSSLEPNSNNKMDDENNDAGESVISQPVEPFVVSIDEEESDSESLSSTPMKPNSPDSSVNAASAKRKLNEKFAEKEENNFGIKTLEQIRMEKIHKESEHFYKSVYDAPLMAPEEIKMAQDSSFKQECYPPVSDFISLNDRPVDKSTSNESSHHSPGNENDLRKRLKRKTPSYVDDSTPSPPKKVVSLKSAKEEDPLNFKIKTLDEIRREKESKLENNTTEASSDQVKIIPNSNFNDSKTVSSTTSPDSSSSAMSNGNLKSVSDGSRLAVGSGKGQRLKITRQWKCTESVLNNNALDDPSSETQKKENRSQMILHEVQNISEDQNKADSPKGKRKETDGSSGSRSIKLLKTESSLGSNSSSLPHISNEGQNSLNEEKQIKKLRRPIIRRNITSSVSPVSSSKPANGSETENGTLNGTKTIELSPISASEPSVKEECVETSEVLEKDGGKETQRTSSVDELDSFLNSGDLTLDDDENPAEKETEDILLEIEQLLES